MENNVPQNNFNEENESSSFDIKIWIIRILKNWYLFFISISMFLTVAYFQNKSWFPIYRSSALVIIEEENRGFNRSQQAFMEGFSVQGGYRNVNNQIVMFSSLDLIKKVVDNLQDLHIEYYTRGRFTSTNLYKKSPVFIEKLFISPNGYEQEFFLEDVGNGKDFLITYAGNKQIAEFTVKGEYGKQLETSLFFITIHKSDFYRNRFQLYFGFRDLDKLASMLHDRLTFAFKMEGSSVLEVSITGNVHERDCDFLNALCDAFLAEGLARKNDAAIKTIEFIDSQMITISDSLRVSERALQNFKSDNFMVAANSSTELSAKYRALETKETELRLKDSYIKYLTNYLEKNIEDGSLIAPTSLGVNEPTLTLLVKDFTEVMFKKKEVGERSPLYAKYTRDLSNIKEQMFEALRNIRVGFNIEKADFDKRMAELQAQIQVLPIKEQQLLNFERKFKVNDNYYSFLLQKRADAQILKASNSPDNIILDKARLTGVTNGASKGSNYSTFLLIGLLIPLAFVGLKEFMYPFIRSENEILHLSRRAYQIIGVIRHTSKNIPVIVDAYPRSAMAEIFRVVRTRMEFLNGKKKNMTMMFTSTHSGEGKTYVSVNMAAIYAMTGKKTILIDSDLRKPSVSATLSLPENKGLSNYLAGQIDLSEAIIKKSNYKFDIMTVGVIPPNPGELMKSQKMKELIKELKEIYDFIIFDAPPIGLVADSYGIINEMDLNIYVVRCERTNKPLFKKTITQLQEDKIPNVYVLFNDVNIRKLEYATSYSNYSKYGKSYYSNLLYKNYKDNNGVYFDDLEDDV